MSYYGYVRTSTSGQIDSVSAQIRRILEKYKNAKIFVDFAVSGGLSPFKRPALSHILSKIGKGDKIVVVSRDRLARSFEVAEEIEKYCKVVGAEVITCGYDDESENAMQSLRSVICEVLDQVREDEREKARRDSGYPELPGLFPEPKLRLVHSKGGKNEHE